MEISDFWKTLRKTLVYGSLLPNAHYQDIRKRKPHHILTFAPINILCAHFSSIPQKLHGPKNLTIRLILTPTCSHLLKLDSAMDRTTQSFFNAGSEDLRQSFQPTRNYNKTKFTPFVEARLVLL